MNMIEKVAISQSEFDGRAWMSMPRGERERYKARARAAIEAMKEPTEEMQEAIWLAAQLQNANTQYGAMISAALKE